jgi:hypothetical protein
LDAAASDPEHRLAQLEHEVAVLEADGRLEAQEKRRRLVAPACRDCQRAGRPRRLMQRGLQAVLEEHGSAIGEVEIEVAQSAAPTGRDDLGVDQVEFGIWANPVGTGSRFGHWQLRWSRLGGPEMIVDSNLARGSSVADDSEETTEATADSGCQVDWGWLTGRRISAATSNLDELTLTFEGGQTLTVTARMWKGQAFLSFDPWRAAS